MNFIFALPYIFIIVLILCLIRKNSKKHKYANAFTGVMLGCLVYYGITPLFLWFNEDYYISNASNWKYSKLFSFLFNDSIGWYNVFSSAAVLIIGILFFVFAYSLVNKKYYEKDTTVRLVSSNNDFYFNKRIKALAFLLLIIGGVSITVYTLAFGGFARAYALAEVLRQHDADITNYGVSGIYSYLLILSGVLTIVPFLLFLVWKNEKRFIYSLLIIISLFLLFIYFLLNNGKSPIIRFVIIVFYMLLFWKNIKHKFIIIGICAVVAVPVLDVLDYVFAQWDINEAIKSFSYQSSILRFCYPTFSNYNMNSITDTYGYMYFTHFITDFISLLPGVEFKSSHVNTSEFFSGSNWQAVGGVPNDLLTYGFLQLRLIGVVVVFFLLGLLSGWFDIKIRDIKNVCSRNMMGIIVCMNMFSVVSCADIQDILLYNLSFTITIIILFAVNKDNRRRFYAKNSAVNFSR